MGQTRSMARGALSKTGLAYPAGGNTLSRTTMSARHSACEDVRRQAKRPTGPTAAGANGWEDTVRTAGYELEFEDTFDDDVLDSRRWIAHYLPHWSNWERSAARYTLGGGCLQLQIE